MSNPTTSSSSGSSAATTAPPVALTNPCPTLNYENPTAMQLCSVPCMLKYLAYDPNGYAAKQNPAFAKKVNPLLTSKNPDYTGPQPDAILTSCENVAGDIIAYKATTPTEIETQGKAAEAFLMCQMNASYPILRASKSGATLTQKQVNASMTSLSQCFSSLEAAATAAETTTTGETTAAGKESAVIDAAASNYSTALSRFNTYFPPPPSSSSSTGSTN